MADKDLEVFKNWNPMKSDYENVDYNKYDRGPGAYLPVDLQVSHRFNRLPAVKPKITYPYLLFSKVPINLTKEGLFNLCSKYGQVRDVRRHKSKNIYFVDFNTVADMEAVYSKLERNNYGFRVIVGTISKEEPCNPQSSINPVNCSETTESNYNEAAETLNVNQINVQKRRIITSSKLNPRPTIFIENEPQGNLTTPILNLFRLLLNDSFALDYKQINLFPDDKVYHYFAGRAYRLMPIDIKEYVDKKLAETFERCNIEQNEMTDEYYYSSNNKKLFSDEFIKFLECAQCGEVSDNICARCSVPFCDISCQRKDWTLHGDNCDNFKRITKEENVAYTFPMPSNKDIVTITAISSSNLVFVRSKMGDSNLEYFRNLESLQSLTRKDLKPLKTDEIIPNQMALHRNKNTNIERVKFLRNIEEDNYVMVLHVDYGNVDKVSIDDLYEIPDLYINMPTMIHCVQLKNVYNYYMTNEIRLFMYTYLQDIEMFINYTADDYLANLDIYQVELIDATTRQNFNEVIINLAEAVPPKSRKDICLHDILERVSPPVGKDIELVVMDNSLMHTSCISCTLPLYACEIEKFQKDIQLYGAHAPSNKQYTPRFGELCIAKYEVDGKWYRGASIEVAGDGYPAILFIDYGNICHVSIDNILPYPEQFTFPIYTFDCEIEGLPIKSPVELLHKFEEHIPNGSRFRCNMNKVENEENYYLISSTLIQALLRKY